MRAQTATQWDIRERDMLLLLLEAVELAPTYVKADIDPATEIWVALKIPGARPYVDACSRRRSARCVRAGPMTGPDAVLKAPASTMVRLILHRIGPLTATRQGLRIVGGRRPWKAMQLQSCIETA